MSPFAKGYRPPPMDKAAQRALGLARTQALPVLELEPDVPLEEQAVSVAEAAELVGVSCQALQKSIARGSLRAFQWQGRRYIRVDDLADTQAAQHQLDEIQLVERSQGLHAEPMLIPLEEHPAWCVVCLPAAEQAEYDRVGAELIDVPAPPPKPKIPWHDPDGKRRAQLAAARAGINARRQAERAARLAAKSTPAASGASRELAEPGTGAAFCPGPADDAADDSHALACRISSPRTPGPGLSQPARGRTGT